jgi:hypothetical protein
MCCLKKVRMIQVKVLENLKKDLRKDNNIILLYNG